MMTIEILISTMFQTDLKFLDAMFINNDLEEFNLIIVNQTSSDRFLNSNLKNITVINSLERGSPISRNIAIENATADICLMADDDIIYQAGLKQTLINAYQHNPKADLISFEAIDEYGQPQANYRTVGPHTKQSLTQIYTWVISFRPEVLQRKAIYFNHHFGVGSTFKGVTEYVFLRNAFDAGLKMVHMPKTIVYHPYESSGKRAGSDNAIFARAAAHQRFYGNLSYIWLVKYILFLLRNNYISWSQLSDKFCTGIKGINKYKALKKSGLIDKLYHV